MNLVDAKKEYDVLQSYFEINIKLGANLMWSLPESLLPIPKDYIEDVINLIAKDYFDRGNHRMSRNIQEVGIGCWSSHYPDNEALSKTAKLLKMVEDNSNLKKTMLDNLVECSVIWSKDKVKATGNMSLSDARSIIGAWDQQLEFNEKAHALEWCLPESALPYPKDMIVQASKRLQKNPIKRLFNKELNRQGDAMLYLYMYKPDGEAISAMYKLLTRVESNPELKKALLNKLGKTVNKWAKSNNFLQLKSYIEDTKK